MNIDELTIKYCDDHASVVGDTEDRINLAILSDIRSYRSGYIAAMEEVVKSM